MVRYNKGYRTSDAKYASGIDIKNFCGKGPFFSSIDAARKNSNGRKLYRISLLPPGSESIGLATHYMITTRDKYLRDFEELFPNEKTAKGRFEKLRVDRLELQAVARIFDTKKRKSIYDFIFP